MSNEIYMAGPWITEFEEKIVLDAVRTGWYGKNAYKYVELFEHEFAAYHNRAYALMTPNCTSALHLLLKGLDIREGDEVIVPECTWIGTAAPIHYQRANIVFADIDPIHWCITPETVEARITNKTKAVIAVDLYGNMPDMEGIKAVCDKYKIYFIEDAAEALGSSYKNVRAGKFGIGSVFSFHRTKTLTTGEGGMLLVDDENLYQRCKFLRDHGRQPGSYYVTEITNKYMPSNLLASLGYAQFKRLDELVEKKRWIWHNYQQMLSDVDDIALNPEPDYIFNSAWCVALVFGEKHKISQEQAMKFFTDHNQPSRPFFYPLSSLPAFKNFVSESNGGRLNNPISYDISNRAINLPTALSITQEQIEQIVQTLRVMLHY
ncbi:MAG: DegT/DnrJ/EryC1/StrS family aminotransferase [Puniceicoccales bacterium]|jgi:perosamine synthetase|nr:DegT/DnrJ/EryC1/StrS family aminotransferase [Puniceicoccales bacterium]